ncbi:FAD-dependent oxidoreductase [Herbiconiux sp.]|uniref:FAD-dependent oxidoreductase n=1 Tax=Herbiconiux sp. TaxID=1871186 RepID=UPI0025BA7564|nr:FAD-dependent oxidoreductase [Herbiconiux sp.]
MATHVDTLIVGAGGIGSAAAWHLARRDAEVLLVEQNAAPATAAPATTAGPGTPAAAPARGRHPFALVHNDPVRLAMLREALPHWHDLEVETGRGLVHETGGVLHGFVPDFDELTERLPLFGIDAHPLDPGAAERRWPGIRFDGRVLFTPQAGQVDAGATIEGLRESASAHGATTQMGTRVTRLRVLGDDEVSADLERVDEHGETIGEPEQVIARRAVVAVGAWTNKLLERIIALPDMAAVRRQRSTHERLDAASGAWPVIAHHPDPASRRYRSWQGALEAVEHTGSVALTWAAAGKAVDPDAGPSRADPRQRAAAQRYVRDWLPGADAGAFTETQTTSLGTADRQFVIDRIGPVVVGAGLSERDFAFVPTIGRILADLTEYDDAPHAPARFSLRPRRRLDAIAR